MASTLKVTNIDTPDGTGNITVDRPLSGSGASLTSLPAANLTGTLPAIDGSALTGVGGGLYASIAIIADRKAYDAQGGTATSGAWRTRDLNTELSDADGIVSISANQFTLQAGTYTIEWSAPCYMGGRGSAKLYNITTSADVGYGNTHYTSASAQSDTFGALVTTISGATVYEIQQRVETTKADYGFGNRFNLDATGYSIYTIVNILKHS
jgi:hypothetical protein